MVSMGILLTIIEKAQLERVTIEVFSVAQYEAISLPISHIYSITIDEHLPMIINVLNTKIKT